MVRRTIITYKRRLQRGTETYSKINKIRVQSNGGKKFLVLTQGTKAIRNVLKTIIRLKIVVQSHSWSEGETR